MSATRCLGYVVGLSFERILTQIGLWSLAVVGVLVVGVVVFEVRRRRRERARIQRDLEVLDAEDDPDGTIGTLDVRRLTAVRQAETGAVMRPVGANRGTTYRVTAPTHGRLGSPTSDRRRP